MTLTLHLGEDTWTESKYLAIGETPEHIELFNGSLVVTPTPAGDHQQVVGSLQGNLYALARDVGLYAFPGNLEIRLSPGHIRIPDFLITTEINFKDSVHDADVVKLACEVISPSSAATDMVLKMRFYAEAGIPWYLLIDPRTEIFRLYRLEGDKYLEHASAAPGELLEITEPVAVTIDPADLLPPR
ncbi:Uma2 family endonuclease [Actinoplanes derwentensis]|uniref:Endonuclease, Uma2 family (Restriction endonuclease fold) n=1 Tax=Actinoplanes derwentensis TaxID=113562 RepID=A0A1H2D2C9_9ACTN|nr:Uma2 family endonuclease [Actinoplanes derwentensis]SDT76697.1 Endonuclease, Uma2 family (restriction endonuclease fold) [Actinoplanes derwentensis]